MPFKTDFELSEAKSTILYLIISNLFIEICYFLFKQLIQCKIHKKKLKIRIWGVLTFQNFGNHRWSMVLSFEINGKLKFLPQSKTTIQIRYKSLLSLKNISLFNLNVSSFNYQDPELTIPRLMKIDWNCELRSVC